MEIGKYIKELLYQHDCVILPGLGGFVANYKPAIFDPDRHVATPPSKQILFNTKLEHNDGLLYAYISKRTGYGYKDVRDQANIYADSVRRDVHRGVKYEIGGLGYFYLDAEGELQFNEESGNNFLIESYGLPLLQYKELSPLPQKETYHSLPGDTAARNRRIRRVVYGTAAACLAAALIMIPVRNGRFNQAGLELPAMEISLQETGRQGKTNTDTDSPDEANPVGRQEITQKAEQMELTQKTDPVLGRAGSRYYIITGSFRDINNARALSRQLENKGYESTILNSENGFFRVSAGVYQEMYKAGNTLAAVREDFEKAWILRN